MRIRIARLEQAYKRGNHAWFASELVKKTSLIEAHYRTRVLQKQFPLRLSAHTSHQALVEKLNIENTFLPPAGIYVLALHEESAIGSVRQLHYDYGDNPQWLDFTQNIFSGVSLARRWIAREHSISFDKIGHYWLETLHQKRIDSREEKQEGESASLSASLAFIISSFKINITRKICATAVIDIHTGDLLPVEGIETKLNALCREAPWMDVLYVSKSQEIPYYVKDRIEKTGTRIIFATNAYDVFKNEWPDLKYEELRHGDPIDIAQNAWNLEQEKDHILAHCYAERALETLDSKILDDPDRLRARLQAQTVKAINLTHRGAAKSALSEFNDIDQILERAPNGLFDANTQLYVLAYKMSTMLDALERTHLIKILEEGDTLLKYASMAAQLVYQGSALRILIWLGQYQEALERSDKQIELASSRQDRYQKPQIICNRIQLYLKMKRAEFALPNIDRKIAQSFNDGYNINDLLPASSAKRNNKRYLDYWQMRYSAIKGDLDRTLMLCQPMTMRMSFPECYYLRFEIEALANHGHIELAIERSRVARQQLSKRNENRFLLLILYSIDAIEALMRIEYDLGNWVEIAQNFIDRFDNYAPGVFARAHFDENTKTQQAKYELKKRLEYLPY